jgi:nucleotide-binding universal stress UspA family protein
MIQIKVEYKISFTLDAPTGGQSGDISHSPFCNQKVVMACLVRSCLPAHLSNGKERNMYKKILVPVALGEGHDYALSFEAARQLADPDADFTVLHAWEPVPAYVLAQVPDELLLTSQRESKAELKEIAEHLPGAKPVLITGHAGRAIVEFADNHGVDCIVLASHKPGLQNLFLGSTANRVVHHAKCAVHVIR